MRPHFVENQSVPFWLVWSPQGAMPPRHRHASEADAVNEAERLAAENPGRDFYVVAPTYRVTISAAIRHSYDGIPF